MRLQLLDVSKGLCIILIVLGHVLRGLHSSGIWANDGLFDLVDSILYTVHVPTLFFVSGYLLSFETTPTWWSFLRRRAVWIVAPYVLWSVIQGSVNVLLSAHTNHPLAWSQLAAIGWQPIAQFWFLYALFWLQTLLFAIRRCDLLAVWGLAVAMWLAGWAAGIHFDGSPLSGLYYLVYVVAGLQGRRMTLSPAFKSPIVLVLVMAAFAGVAMVLLACGVRYGSPFLFPASVLGIMAVMAISQVISHSKPAAGVLSIAGQGSMAILVMHILFTAGSRMTISTMADRMPFAPSVPLQVVCGTLAGVVMPLVVFEGLKRLGLNRAVGLR
jgi:fucose 4-O-acetylase-like acetyltransferase